MTLKEEEWSLGSLVFSVAPGLSGAAAIVGAPTSWQKNIHQPHPLIIEKKAHNLMEHWGPKDIEDVPRGNDWSEVVSIGWSIAQ